MKFFESLKMALSVYKTARQGGSHLYYFGLKDGYDVPQACVIVGMGREAWRVSHLAINAWPPIPEYRKDPNG